MVIRFADPAQFEMSAASYSGISNIENPAYSSVGILHTALGIGDGPANILVGAIRLRNLIRKYRIDILHTHHFYESVMGWLATRGTRCHHVVGRHYHVEFYLTTKGLKLRGYLALESMVQKSAAALIVPSTDIAKLVQRQGNEGRNLKVIPYGFDFSAIRYNPVPVDQLAGLRMELELEGKFVIGNFARHHEIKGQIYLIDAFKEFHKDVPDACLLMIGDGPAHATLQNAARGLTAVKFLGWRRDAHLLMNLANVIVHPSLQEAFPQVMVEAMSVGKPLIITPVSGVMDQVTDGETALVIPMRDSASIASALRRVYDNPAWAFNMGRQGASYVRKHLNAHDVVKEFETLYLSILKAHD